MKLDSEEFEALAYAYRSWPGHDQQGVIAAFEALKRAIEEMIEEERESAYRSRPY